MIRRLAAMLPLLLAATAAESAERRCGWFLNPSPANFWLVDRDGRWELMTQGGRYIPGMLTLPDMRAEGWIATNANRQYGYSCACLTMDVDRRTRRATRIARAEPLALSRCQEDPSLPPP